MRSVSLLLSSSIFASACASMPTKRVEMSEYRHEYKVISMDASICGRVGTLRMDDLGEVSVEVLITKKGERRRITFFLTDPSNKEKAEFSSELYLRGDMMAFRLGNDLIGNRRFEHKEDGEYMIINFKSDPSVIEEAERELEKVKSWGPRYNSLLKEQEAKVKKLKQGFEWVLKRK